MPEEIQTIAVEGEQQQAAEESVSEYGQLSEQEQQMAKDHGLMPDESETKEPGTETQEDKKPQETDGKQEGQREEAEKEVPDVENMFVNESKEQEGLKHFNKNEQALYFRMKRDRAHRQEAQRKEELSRVQIQAIKRQAQQMADQLQKVGTEYGLEVAVPEDFKPQEHVALTPEQWQQRQQEQQAQEQEHVRAREARMAQQEKQALVLDDKFLDVCSLAKEVVAADTTGVYSRIIAEEANRPDGYLPEKIYKIAKLHPDYGKNPMKKAEGKQSSKIIEKIATNASKGMPSAAVGTSESASFRSSEDDITIDQAGRMSPAEWGSLSNKTRRRLLGE